MCIRDSFNDVAILNSLSGTISGIMSSCAPSCFVSGEDCRICLQAITSLSDMCTDCFIAEFNCMTDNCSLECFNDRDVACINCRIEACADTFFECSGIVYPE